MKNKTPGINTASTADISFLLLTFFLLTSSINTDQGIQRKLPPPIPDNAEKPQVNERNVLLVLVNMYDQLLVNGQPMNNVEDLKARTKEFITNPTDNPNMPEKKLQYVPALGREAVISKGIVSLRSDRGTSYKMYIAVQNQLAAAFNEIRDDYSRQNYGKNFDKLSKGLKEGVATVVPISISEAEPSNYGGKKK